MKIGDRIFVRGYIDEIRKDTVIVRNDGGYFGTVLSEVTGELPSAQPEIPPYVAEIEAEYKKWINVPCIRKPLAKALYEVWKKHDEEDAGRRTDE